MLEDLWHCSQLPCIIDPLKRNIWFLLHLLYMECLQYKSIIHCILLTNNIHTSLVWLSKQFHLLCFLLFLIFSMMIACKQCQAHFVTLCIHWAITVWPLEHAPSTVVGKQYYQMVCFQWSSLLNIGETYRAQTCRIIGTALFCKSQFCLHHYDTSNIDNTY